MNPSGFLSSRQFPQGGEAQEGRSFRLVSTLVGDLDCLREKSPEEEAQANLKRVATSERVYDSRTGKTSLKGKTPRASPARNKAGRMRADQSLESVETLRRHLNPVSW